MSDNKKINKRNYIRRKKYLNDSANQIKATLEFIQAAKGESFVDQNIQKLAYIHAQAIEAVCWSPHSKLSAEGYQKLMTAKTHELCRMFIKKSVSDLNHLSHHPKLNYQNNIFMKDADIVSHSPSSTDNFTCLEMPDRPQTPQPSLPIPIIPQSAPVSNIESIFPDSIFSNFEAPEVTNNNNNNNNNNNEINFDSLDIKTSWPVDDDSGFFQNVNRFDDQFQY